MRFINGKTLTLLFLFSAIFIPTAFSFETAVGGDCIHMLKTRYIDLGESGRGRVWDIPADMDGESISATCILDSDTLTVLLHNNKYTYIFSKDTLRLLDTSNRTSSIEYGETGMKIPVKSEYGDTIFSQIVGRAVYSEKLRLSFSGTATAIYHHNNSNLRTEEYRVADVIINVVNGQVVGLETILK